MINNSVRIEDCPEPLQVEVGSHLKNHENAKIIAVQKWDAGVSDSYLLKYMVLVESGNQFLVLRLYVFENGAYGDVEKNTINAGEIIELVSYSELLQQFLKLRKG
ncbi:hypothetical protein [Paenibacillus taichungensis]|uniref:hypothetical protein n=1 Tax=Paenibacillus taichungensis TaxID=484184 RepID=UPI0035E2DC9C